MYKWSGFGNWEIGCTVIFVEYICKKMHEEKNENEKKETL